MLHTMAESLMENYDGRCDEGFWLWPRRRGRSIPAAGCDDRANAGHGQKTRRPEGFRAKDHLASLILGQRPMKGSPSSRLAIRPFPRKQRPSEFSIRLFVLHLEDVVESRCVGIAIA